MITASQKKIINLLITQERLISRLYAIFSDKFAAHKDFWKTLAKEELVHAKWLEQLYEAGEKDLVHFDEKKITTISIELFIKGIEDTIRRAQSDELDVRTALIKTADIERSLIEKNVFSQFSGITEKAKNTMKRLEKETREHLSRVEALHRQELVS